MVFCSQRVNQGRRWGTNHNARVESSLALLMQHEHAVNLASLRIR